MNVKGVLMLLWNLYNLKHCDAELTHSLDFIESVNVGKYFMIITTLILTDTYRSKQLRR